MNVITWRGEANRRPRITEPCDCASDRLITPEGTYAVLSGSEAKGNGFTVFLTFEDVEELRRQLVEVVTLGDLSDPFEDPQVASMIDADNERRGRML